MKICQKCNSQNPDDAKYCWSCGQEIQQTGLKCPHCNQIILEDDEIKAFKYCPFCGTNLVAQVNTINGHEYVDLGLSVKWATCNIGASSPSEYGDCYAWGETTPKSEYTKDNCKTYGIAMSEITGSSYDVARARWGGSWRLPNRAEFEELKDRCTWKWVSENGHYGYRIIGPNDKFIFLPAAGIDFSQLLVFMHSLFWSKGQKQKIMKCGYYFSSTPDEYCNNSAYALYFDSEHLFVDSRSRFFGYRMRPVLD